MRTLCHFSGRGEMPEGKEVGGIAEKGHRRARARLTPVLSALAVLLLLISITSPGAGQAASLGGNGKSASGIDRDGKGEAYVTMAGGGRQINIRNKSVGDIEPGGSANGTKIALSNSRTSIGDDIFVMNADGTGQSNLTDDPEPRQ